MQQPKVVEIPLAMGGPRQVSAFLVLGDRTVVVDTGTPGNATRILETLEEQGRQPEDVSLIVITHVHWDHSGSAWNLAEVTRAPVAVQRGEAEKLAVGETMPVEGRTEQARRFIQQLTASRPGRPPVLGVRPKVLVDEELALEPFGVAGTIIHTPGHTTGSLSVLLDSGEAIVGDLIGSEHQDPGKPEPGMFAMDPEAMEASIRRVLQMRPKVVYTGHDGPFPYEKLVEVFG